MMQQPMPQSCFGLAEDAGQAAQRRGDVAHFRRDECAHERRPAAHHHGAVAVDDQAARCGDRDELNLIRAGGVGKRIALHDLHLREPYDDRDQREREKRDERRKAQRRPRRRGGFDRNGAHG